MQFLAGLDKDLIHKKSKLNKLIQTLTARASYLFWKLFLKVYSVMYQMCKLCCRYFCRYDLKCNIISVLGLTFPKPCLDLSPLCADDNVLMWPSRFSNPFPKSPQLNTQTTCVIHAIIQEHTKRTPALHGRYRISWNPLKMESITTGLIIFCTRFADSSVYCWRKHKAIKNQWEGPCCAGKTSNLFITERRNSVHSTTALKLTKVQFMQF